MQLSLESSNKELDDYFTFLSNKTNDLSPLEEIYGDIFRLDLKSRFISSPSTTTGGRVHGGKYWKPLSKSYLASRPERESGQIYIDSGRLRDSLTVKGNTEQIARFKTDSISKEYVFEFGTKVEYADKLQEQREILFIHPALEERLVNATTEFIGS